jgi:hypothetical protein
MGTDIWGLLPHATWRRIPHPHAWNRYEVNGRLAWSLCRRCHVWTLDAAPAMGVRVPHTGFGTPSGNPQVVRRRGPGP